MNALLLLIPLSLLLLAAMVTAFIWAVRSRQFEDMETPPIDILRDDER
jgi:cbb3-type cytochrome oxidase maturation protein